MVSCCTKNGAKPAIIDRQPVEIKDGRLSPEALWAMGRLGEVAVSPDGQYVAYSVRYYSVAENKGNTDLYLCDIDGQNVRRLTRTAASENNLCWLNEHTLAYLYPAGDGMQMFGIDLKNVFKVDVANGTIADTYKQLKPVQITSIPGGMEGFRLSPDQGKIAFVRQVQAEPTVQDRYPDLDKSSGMIFNDLNYRHWDEWVSGIPHIFVSELSGADLNTALGSVKASQPVDILKNEPYESPVKPFGGIEQFAWSTDGQYLAYTCRKLTGKDYALSTNTDIYLYSPESGSTVNLSEGMMGYDVNPAFSPDGKYLAWESMERDGYESDKSRLMLLNLQTSEKTDATRDFDQNANGLQWSADSKYIYFISNYHALSQIYRLEVESNAIECLTGGVHDYNSVYPVNENLLLGTRASMSTPEEMFSVDLGAADADAIHPQTQISFINKDIMDRLDAGKVEERWIKTTDNKKMLAWVIYPPHFDPEKKYPALLYCQGGPQSTVSQFWSYRWNLQIMAANDYIIIAPNRRGLPGFGMEWLEQISGDYGGQNMKDYLSAIDDLCKEPYVDKDRLGCVGASYGAFSVYWLAGHHEKRFKGFIAHDGMFNLEQQYAETEELWFTNWDLGGPFWEKDNKVAQRSYANSPHRFVDKWDAPIFVIHGELDYRILASQGMAAFNSAVLRGIPAELLIFPDENHWVLQPQNGILWQRRFFRFLDKYVKGLSDAELDAKYYGEQAFSMKDPFGDQAQRVAKGGSKEQNTEKQVAQ
ncbi:MAG: S9 family peptidase [Bacteroides sp.]|nr:S9 family peptidase [Bacteroides sp.]